MGGGRRHPALSADQGSGQARRSAGRKYRLVDIPISNCLNSDLRRIFVLTQFNSSSLHRHIQESYRFDNFSPGLRGDPRRAAADRPAATGIRAPPTPSGRTCCTSTTTPTGWCSSCRATSSTGWTIRAFIEQHVASGAEVTVATTPVRPEAAARLRDHGGRRPTAGSLDSSKSRRTRVLASLRVDWSRVPAGRAGDPDALPASMGIYVFDRDVLDEALAGTEADFGKHVIPEAHRDPPGATPSSTRGTGRTSGPSARSTRPTSISAPRCPNSTSTTRPRRSSPTRAICRPPRSSRAGSSARSSPTAASSTTRISSTP